jgi:hypothetical protein
MNLEASISPDDLAVKTSSRTLLTNGEATQQANLRQVDSVILTVVSLHLPKSVHQRGRVGWLRESGGYRTNVRIDVAQFIQCSTHSQQHCKTGETMGHAFKKASATTLFKDVDSRTDHWLRNPRELDVVCIW